MAFPKWIKAAWTGDQWKRVYAWTMIYGFIINVVLWGPLQWAVGIWNALTNTQIPGPPLIPWEQLAVMAGALGMIGSIELFKKPKSGDDVENRRNAL